MNEPSREIILDFDQENYVNENHEAGIQQKSMKKAKKKIKKKKKKANQ